MPKQSWRYLGILLLLVVIAVIAVVLGVFQGPQQGSGSITLGVVTCQTGSLTDFGTRFTKVAQAAADEVNQNGGLGPNHLQLKLAVRDDATDPDQGRQAAQDLINNEGVPAIFGSCSSGSTIAISGVSTADHVVQISSSATSPSISTLDDNDYLFRTAPSDALQGALLAQVAYNASDDGTVPGRGYRSISIIARNDAYGAGLADELATNFTKLGGTVVGGGKPILYPTTPEPSDFSAFIQQAVVGNPDAIAIVAFNEGETLIQQMVQEGVSNFDLFTDGTQNADMFNRLASTVGEKVLLGKSGTGPANYPGTAGYANFLKVYHRVLPDDASPFVFTPATYDAIYVLALSIEKVLDANGGNASAVTGQAIRDNLRAVANAPGQTITVGDWAQAKRLIAAGTAVNYDGAGGPVEFDANGDTVGPEAAWHIVKLDTGKLDVPTYLVCSFGEDASGAAQLKSCQASP